MTALMTRLVARSKASEGVTLIEVMVALVLTSILGLIVTIGMTALYKAQRTTDVEAQGLSDVRTVVERLGRDLRDARGVYPGADASHLAIWIDYNSDYKIQNDEIITWSLQSSCGTCNYKVLRSLQGGAPREEAHTLVSNIAFCYSTAASTDPPPCVTVPSTGLDTATAAKVTLVTVTVTYNAGSTSLANHATRTTTFTERLRNV